MLHYYLKQSTGLLGMPLVVGLLIVGLALAYQLRGRTRALWLMGRASAHPIPALVGQRARGMDGNLMGALIPGSSGLYETEHAFHEYVGLLAMTLGLD